MEPTEPITIRASKDVVSQIDTLAVVWIALATTWSIRPSSNTLPIITSYNQKIEQGLKDAERRQTDGG